MNGFGNNSRRGAVPLETARKIARQRNELAEEVERLREKNRDLAERSRASESAVEELESRAADMEERIEQLQNQLEEERETSEAGTDSASERVGKLERRIASLTDDLERVRSRAGSSAERARREERIRLLSELGEVIDSVERGLSMVDDEGERAGLEGIYNQLRQFLRDEGAKLTGEPGIRHDPRLHEAIDVLEHPEYESGSIVEVTRPGIALEDGTVVLPARVRVAA